MSQASCARLNSRSAAVIATLARSLSWLLFRIWRRTSMICRFRAASALTRRGALALVFIVERGALHHAQHVAGLDNVAGAHLIDDGAWRLGKQRRADRGHHQAGGGHVAHEGSALHRRDAQALARDHLLGRQPGMQAPDHQQQHRERDAANGSVSLDLCMTGVPASATTRSWDWVPRIETSRSSMVMHDVKHVACQRNVPAPNCLNYTAGRARSGSDAG